MNSAFAYGLGGIRRLKSRKLWGIKLSFWKKDCDDSLRVLSSLSVIKEAERKVEKSKAVITGYDGIAFIGRDGELTEALMFKDFDLENLKKPYETDIICQYFICRYGEITGKEFHGISNKLSDVFMSESIKN